MDILKYYRGDLAGLLADFGRKYFLYEEDFEEIYNRK